MPQHEKITVVPLYSQRSRSLRLQSSHTAVSFCIVSTNAASLGAHWIGAGRLSRLALGVIMPPRDDAVPMPGALTQLTRSLLRAISVKNLLEAGVLELPVHSMVERSRPVIR